MLFAAWCHWHFWHQLASHSSYLVVHYPNTGGAIIALFKRNAKAFSLNAIVDVRRRHEMIFWEYLGNYKC